MTSSPLTLSPTGTVRRLLGGLVVSSQTHRPGGPLDHPETLARLALAAEHGGAAGFRVASAAVVEALRPHTERPIIGISKTRGGEAPVYITPTVSDALRLIDAGADVIAADAATEGRPAESFADIVVECHRRGVAVMADCASIPVAVRAVADGADIVATTLAGYTADTAHVRPPALSMAAALAETVSTPVAVEGGIWGPADIQAAFHAGASIVVVGSAITDPERITRLLVDMSMPKDVESSVD